MGGRCRNICISTYSRSVATPAVLQHRCFIDTSASHHDPASRCRSTTSRTYATLPIKPRRKYPYPTPDTPSTSSPSIDSNDTSTGGGDTALKAHEPDFSILTSISEALEASTSSPPSQDPPFDHDPSSPQPSNTLPQSPLLSLALLAGRARYNTSSYPPKVFASSFSDRLKSNPWARLLASPIRSCALTGFRLPSALLGDWKLMSQPPSPSPSPSPIDTGVRAPSLLPSDLTSPFPQHIHRPSLGLKIRILPSLPLLHHTTQLLSTRRTAATHQRRLLDRRWRDSLPVLGTSQKGKTYFLWRPDMPTLYSSLLRQKVVGALVFVSRYQRRMPVLVRSRAQLSTSDSPLQLDQDAARRLDRAVALLWIGPRPLDTAPSTADEAPYTRASTHLPVFDLPHLLGADAMTALRASVPTTFGLSTGATQSSTQSSPSGPETGDKRAAASKTQKGNWVVIKMPREKNGGSVAVASVKTEEVCECVGWLWRAEGYFGAGVGSGGGTGEEGEGDGEGEIEGGEGEGDDYQGTVV